MTSIEDLDTKRMTSVAPAAARLALTCVARESGRYLIDRVLVEENAVVATDGQRLIIIEEPHAEGLFRGEEEVALVPPDALSDAGRGKHSRISVRPDHLVTYHHKEENQVIRLVPFELPEPLPGPTPESLPVKPTFPDWRAVRPKRRRVAVRLNPALLADVMKRLAAEGVTSVDFCIGKSDEVVSIHAELLGERAVTFLVMPITAPTPALPGVPQVDRKAAAAAGDEEDLQTECAEQNRTAGDGVGALDDDA